MKYFWVKSKKINFFKKPPKAKVLTTICITIFCLKPPQKPRLPHISKKNQSG
ncbi:hypothetical protein HanRHA438_Chr02g0096041 [Helianthus annuus]|nr:hypothetical protein HanRHA438_Chr02g0096041 [Helianthus annuus]